MDERLKKITGNGDVDALYSLLVEDPLVLERIDRLPIVDTPLHIAAAAGNTRFAMEIVTLKPSFARKLNPQGLSPIHLALQNGHDPTVKAMIADDTELVRVKAKGRITPLHYAAEIDNFNLLAEFLNVCPSSVEDLTVKRETAVHIAVKNKKRKAFKVLKGWLLRNKREILKWTDEDGNNALHIATSTNQLQVMEMLIENVDINAMNSANLTAMDIYLLQENSLNQKIGNVLRRAKAKTASEITMPPVTLADKLMILAKLQSGDKQ
ncbi:Ankyrin repeat family protein [Melia azedarach]|uniref:Ankyrin repeat family protein n=1 Tax=Melia azedarach TaxID=155640 RepID=A0ACC1YC35_MELAZ|nr:Ankyrin repeat family protein [Melia azedarach]